MMGSDKTNTYFLSGQPYATLIRRASSPPSLAKQEKDKKPRATRVKDLNSLLLMLGEAIPPVSDHAR
jgi:hypothetical protein